MVKKDKENGELLSIPKGEIYSCKYMGVELLKNGLITVEQLMIYSREIEWRGKILLTLFCFVYFTRSCQMHMLIFLPMFAISIFEFNEIHIFAK